MQAARLPLQQEIRDPECFRGSLGQARRSVSEKAPLQDQFSEGTPVGWSCVKRRRHLRVTQERDECDVLNAKIKVGKGRVVARPTFRFRKNNSAQDLAALHLHVSLCLLCRFGMEWTRGLRRLCLCRQRSERAMIRDCNPRTDRHQDGRGAQARSHRGLQSLTRGQSQTFSCGGSTTGATAPDAIPPGGTASAGSNFSLSWSNCGCSTRVASSIAVNNKAAAR
jgi:hypothetical protein